MNTYNFMFPEKGKSNHLRITNKKCQNKHCLQICEECSLLYLNKGIKITAFHCDECYCIYCIHNQNENDKRRCYICIKERNRIWKMLGFDEIKTIALK